MQNIEDLPGLPDGEIVTTREGEPAFWISDDEVTPGLWQQFRRRHASTGLWPVLLRNFIGEPGPFHDGKFSRHPGPDVASLDAEALLAKWWDKYNEEFEAELGPWPGLAPSGPLTIDPDAQADSVVGTMETWDDMRLGLMTAERSADVIVQSCWGAETYGNEQVSAVVRSWEDRFGARVICFDGSSTLFLSVAAPPRDLAQAERITAEHVAFCSDVLQERDLDEHAEWLIDRPYWWFWWD
jgi:hypothetical protein